MLANCPRFVASRSRGRKENGEKENLFECGPTPTTHISPTCVSRTRALVCETVMRVSSFICSRRTLAATEKQIKRGSAFRLCWYHACSAVTKRKKEKQRKQYCKHAASVLRPSSKAQNYFYVASARILRERCSKSLTTSFSFLAMLCIISTPVHE